MKIKKVFELQKRSFPVERQLADLRDEIESAWIKVEMDLKINGRKPQNIDYGRSIWTMVSAAQREGIQEMDSRGEDNLFRSIGCADLFVDNLINLIFSTKGENEIDEILTFVRTHFDIHPLVVARIVFHSLKGITSIGAPGTTDAVEGLFWDFIDVGVGRDLTGEKLWIALELRFC